MIDWEEFFVWIIIPCFFAGLLGAGLMYGFMVSKEPVVSEGFIDACLANEKSLSRCQTDSLSLFGDVIECRKQLPVQSKQCVPDCENDCYFDVNIVLKENCRLYGQAIKPVLNWDSNCNCNPSCGSFCNNYSNQESQPDKNYLMGYPRYYCEEKINSMICVPIANEGSD